MPVFCLSEYDECDIIEEEGKTFVKVSKDKIDGIKNDFKDATHALIIFEPDKFIDDVRSIKGHNIVSDSIRYYDYDYKYHSNVFFSFNRHRRIQKRR